MTSIINRYDINTIIKKLLIKFFDCKVKFQTLDKSGDQLAELKIISIHELAEYLKNSGNKNTQVIEWGSFLNSEDQIGPVILSWQNENGVYVASVFEEQT